MTKTIAAWVTALLMLPSVAHAWWNDEWTFRKQSTFNTGKADADLQQGLADVPVRLHTGNFQYFTDVAADGADIRFIDADDQTPLKFHIEKFDVANQMAFIWVKAPKLAVGEGSDTIWMYYGNAKAAPAQDAAGTYDKNQALVYHFDTATGIPQDRTHARLDQSCGAGAGQRRRVNVVRRGRAGTKRGGHLVVGRVRKDNRAFLQQFKQLGAGDPHALDAIESEEEKAFEHSPVSMVLFGKHDHFQGSSLYHIYHAGVREAVVRFSGCWAPWWA